MKLSDFSVSNYRSITKAHKVQMQNLTVLVGKNNEGKSNILKALSLAMDIMNLCASHEKSKIPIGRLLRYGYDWDKDFPIALQETKSGGSSTIDLNLRLLNDDAQTIRELTGVGIYSGVLPVRVSIYSSHAQVTLPKRGSAAFGDEEKKQKMIKFICSKIDFNLIPAIRTEHDALSVINSLITKELAVLESDLQYAKAVKLVESYRQNILNDAADRLIEPMKVFLPSTEAIKIHLEKEQNRLPRRNNFEVIIDDGTPTPLTSKGDGVKSLIALVMLNTRNETRRVSKTWLQLRESFLEYKFKFPHFFRCPPSFGYMSSLPKTIAFSVSMGKQKML